RCGSVDGCVLSSGAQGAVAVSEQERNLVRESIDRGDVGTSVTVHITNRQAIWKSAGIVDPAATEGTIPLAEKHHGAETRRSQVRLAVAIEVSDGHGGRANPVVIELSGECAVTTPQQHADVFTFIDYEIGVSVQIQIADGK